MLKIENEIRCFPLEKNGTFGSVSEVAEVIFCSVHTVNVRVSLCIEWTRKWASGLRIDQLLNRFDGQPVHQSITFSSVLSRSSELRLLSASHFVRSTPQRHDLCQSLNEPFLSASAYMFPVILCYVLSTKDMFMASRGQIQILRILVSPLTLFQCPSQVIFPLCKHNATWHWAEVMTVCACIQTLWEAWTINTIPLGIIWLEVPILQNSFKSCISLLTPLLVLLVVTMRTQAHGRVTTCLR